MEFYLAPMEGVTGYVYRNTYEKHFHNIDKYMTPFISPGAHRHFKSKELKDVHPEHNRNMPVAIQMLTNNAEGFLTTARTMKEFGYEEVNINLGCPSGTVVSKGKGAGFLGTPDKLNHFFEEVFEHLDTIGIQMSVKTRIGKDSYEEWEGLLKIYNQYPISELIIHPRIQKEMYKNTPNMEAFALAVQTARADLVYNGDIFSKEAYQKVTEEFPTISKVMLGRGVIANPGLIDYIKTGKELDNETFQNFYYDLFEEYRKEIQGDTPVLFKMKEMWFYMLKSFTENERYLKKIRKANSLMELNSTVDVLLREQHIVYDQVSF